MTKDQGSVKKLLIKAIAIIVIIVVYFLFAAHFTPSSSKAYLHGYIIKIAPQVSGQITKMYVHNNEIVEKGQPLFEIDRRPYLYANQIAQSNLENTSRQINETAAQIKSLQSTVAERTNDLATAKSYLDRFTVLSKKGFVSEDTILNYHQRYIDTKAKLADAQQQLISEQQKLGNKTNGENIHLEEARSQLKIAQYNYEQTIVTAPVSGKIINLYVNVGNYAQAGAAQFALVNYTNWWVEANFNENNLGRVKLGQPVLVSISMYPGKIFHGHVAGLADAVNLSQNVPENYAPYIEKEYTWIRIPQAFPVQIKLDNPPKILRAGASAYATILTTQNFFWKYLAYFCQAIQSLWQFIS